MFYIILIIILALAYFIYKRRKPKIEKKEETMADMQVDIKVGEESLLRKIKTNHLGEDYMTTETDLLKAGKHNFVCLSERFKHDEVKLRQVTKDWLDYIEILKRMVYENEIRNYLSAEDSSAHFEAEEKQHIRLREIIKRFKDLLGAEYWDFEEFQKLRIKESNKNFIEKMEADLLNYMETNSLKDFMATEKADFNSGKKNFILLSKRFEHDNAKFAEVTKDWIAFMNILREGISTESLLLTASTEGEDSPESMKAKIALRKKRQDVEKRFNEIKKRFKDLIGDEYVVPEEDLKKDTRENTKRFIEQEESELLNLIRTNNLNDYIKREAARFDFHRKNFILLSERFENDAVKFEEISSHWITYMDMLNEAIKQSLIADLPAAAFTDSKDGLSVRSMMYVTREKMERYFKNLLEDNYLDFEEFEKSHIN